MILTVRAAARPRANKSEERALLNVVLVNARNGIVQAQRGVTFSPEFTREWHEAIRRQAAAPWRGEAAYDAQLTLAYGRYPDTRSLLARATLTTKGGA